MRRKMKNLLKKLEGGDRRSIGRVEEVITEVLANSQLIKILIDGLFVDSPLVRMRAADALEKISSDHPQYLKPFKKKIIRLAAQTEQQEVRWHVAQMITRLHLTPKEKSTMTDILFDYLHDKSNIVITFSLQALADFAAQDKTLRPRVIKVLNNLIQTGSPAVKNRGKKLLARLTAD
jgi:hypothetical protein